MAKTSLTKLSMDYLKKRGFTCYKAEHYNPFAGKTFDAFGFADILALREDRVGVLAVQSTSKPNWSTRRNKILASPEAALWKKCGNQIWIMGWYKSNNRWDCLVMEFQEDWVDIGNSI